MSGTEPPTSYGFDLTTVRRVVRSKLGTESEYTDKMRYDGRVVGLDSITFNRCAELIYRSLGKSLPGARIMYSVIMDVPIRVPGIDIAIVRTKD